MDRVKGLACDSSGILYGHWLLVAIRRGLIGGCAGGTLAALTSFAVLDALRYCIFVPLYLATCVLEVVVGVSHRLF